MIACMTSPALTTEPSQTRLLRKPAVLDRVGFSDTTLWRLVRSHAFPASIRLSAHMVAWRESDVEDWIHQRAAASGR